MDMEDLHTGIIEGVNSNDYEGIELSLPNLFDKVRMKFSGKSMKIDKILVRYSALCPPNARGYVRLEVIDRRLDGADGLQAYYVIQVDCHCELTYHGNGYCSANEKQVPWIVRYKLEDSNIHAGVRYCKMLGFLRYASADMPGEQALRAPSVKILNKKYGPHNICVWHCQPSKPVPYLGRARSLSMGHCDSRLVTGGFGETSIDLDHRLGPRLSLNGPRLIEEPSDMCSDIGPSVSQVGHNRPVDTVTGSASVVVVEPRDLLGFVKDVVDISCSRSRREGIGDSKLETIDSYVSDGQVQIGTGVDVQVNDDGNVVPRK